MVVLCHADKTVTGRTDDLVEVRLLPRLVWTVFSRLTIYVSGRLWSVVLHNHRQDVKRSRRDWVGVWVEVLIGDSNVGSSCGAINA